MKCPMGRPESPDDVAVETAEEAKEPAEADINELCRDMFSKMATYLTGELTATSEDYKLLENMNKLTSLKYLEMKDIAINISRNLKDLNQKYAGLQPYLDQINIIEEQVAALEQAAYKLDAYSKKLGMWDLSSPTRDQACALCIGRSQVQEAGEAMKNNCGDKVFFNVERMFYKT
ncbi:biogenesis of lysosome-related organelles complex 1 subunit 2 isoform X2 [Bubalus kerabau]|uniref:biogenesis of lysosome-related organelles complex 1 subunit 2 isoform X2 n=1 Tax=Bubalus bubalis TaxID=89462 RepID=UPI001D129B74|nr:biogenesis of lysosome-related organelles complex 1 subunit 2 isoform X2 [Bubalus bubalis]XP_055416533.1 biogenesis of lysosome-related organelles complex 1 subunit 2 isoform X2 [Bubalus carabanensis]